MSKTMLREAIETLMKEIYEGPADPKGPTWVVSNGADSGLFGALRPLSPAQASAKPKGASHSVAEHVAHLKFSLDVNLRYAQGEEPGKLDWESSWHVPNPLTSDVWQRLLRSLHDSWQALLSWAQSKEEFDNFFSVCGFTASVAHSAYHLGAIRQLAAIARASPA